MQKIYSKIKKDENTIVDYSRQIKGLSEMEQLQLSIISGFKFTAKLFSESDLPEALQPKSNQHPSNIINWFVDHSNNVGELADRSNFNAVKKECSEIGLGEFVVQALESELPPRSWEQSFHRRFYFLLSGLIFGYNPIFQKFLGSME